MLSSQCSNPGGLARISEKMHWSEANEKMLDLLDYLGLGCIDLTCDQELQHFYEKFGMLKSHGIVLRKKG